MNSQPSGGTLIVVGFSVKVNGPGQGYLRNIHDPRVFNIFFASIPPIPALMFIPCRSEGTIAHFYVAGRAVRILN